MQSRRRPDLILIAGLPATGKSRFAAVLERELDLPLLSKDAIKEVLFDTVGFASHAEKTALNVAAAALMHQMAEQVLRHGGSLILENNYENYAKPALAELAARCDCRVHTVFFEGDSEVLYRRYLARNADPARHRGHVLSTRYPENEEDAGQIPPPIPFEEFALRFRERGMADPPLDGGALLRVDATDFAAVDYGDILRRLRSLLERGD